ncbi:MAG: hypothetical protein ACOY93_04560 [Bacillota bacterium]
MVLMVTLALVLGVVAPSPVLANNTTNCACSDDDYEQLNGLWVPKGTVKQQPSSGGGAPVPPPASSGGGGFWSSVRRTVQEVANWTGAAAGAKMVWDGVKAYSRSVANAVKHTVNETPRVMQEYWTGHTTMSW